MVVLHKGFSKIINDRSIFRIAVKEDEIKKIAQFNVKIHNEPLYDYIVSLFISDPFRDESFWLYIEDSETGEVMSSLALLSNYWSFGQSEIRIAEMGFVGTLEEQRGKGLYRILNKFYEKLMIQEGLSVSVLRGIPYFYSKYGYGFALPTDTGYCLKVDQFKLKEKNNDLSIKRASSSDINIIEKLYNDIFSSIFISTTFKPERFQFKFNSTELRENFGITYVVEEKNVIIGFFTLAPIYDSSNSDIYLISNMEIEVIKHVIQYVIETFEIKEKICMNLNDIMLSKSGISEFELQPLRGWKWQIKITNLEKLIYSLLPILEERLSGSSFHDTIDDISISNFNEIVYLKIENCKVTIIDHIKGYPGGDISIRVPFSYLPMYIFGDESYEEIKSIVPDIMITPKYRELSEVLFPKSPSFPIYRY